MSNSSDNYDQFVARLVKPGVIIAGEITPADLDRIHMLMGICGEAGELLDAIKKAAIYRKPLDLINIVEELGDIEFYLQGLRNNLGVSRETVIYANISKLQKRYPDGYSNKAAVERADKAV